MAASEDCGGKAGLLATVCPACTTKRNEQLKKQKAAENAAAEQERQLLIAEEYKRIIHDVKAGFNCFLYNSYYVSVDGILAGGNFESNVYDDVNVKLAGLEGWKVVGIIPHTFGELLTNTQGYNKIWAGGTGGNVVGAYVLMELALNPSNVEKHDEEISEYLQRTIN